MKILSRFYVAALAGLALNISGALAANSGTIGINTRNGKGNIQRTKAPVPKARKANTGASRGATPSHIKYEGATGVETLLPNLPGGLAVKPNGNQSARAKVDSKLKPPKPR